MNGQGYLPGSEQEAGEGRRSFCDVQRKSGLHDKYFCLTGSGLFLIILPLQDSQL
jgi:hypothetical protein